MENKTVNLGEAFKSVFATGWFLKYFLVLLISALTFAGSFLGLIFQNRAFQTKDIPALLLVAAVMFVSTFIVSGYYTLYAHDRALDKNAELKSLALCPFDSFLVGINVAFGFFINHLALSILLFIICIPIFIVLFLIGLIPVIGAIINFLLMIVFFITYIVIFINLLSRFYFHFVKDLKLISWFQWRKALEFTKDVPFGKLQGFLAIFTVLIVGLIGFIALMAIYIPPMLMSANITTFIIIMALSIPVMIFLNFFTFLFWANLSGQYTYNAIERKIGASPEKLPKDINQNYVVTIILAILIFLFYGGIMISSIMTQGMMRNNPFMTGGKMNNSMGGNFDPSSQNQYLYCQFTNEEGTFVGTTYIPGKGPSRDCNDTFFVKTPEDKERCIRDNKIFEKMYKNGECKPLNQNFGSASSNENDYDTSENNIGYNDNDDYNNFNDNDDYNSYNNNDYDDNDDTDNNDFSFNNNSFNDFGSSDSGSKKYYDCSFVDADGTHVSATYNPEGSFDCSEDSIFGRTAKDREKCKEHNRIIEKMYQNGECKEQQPITFN